MVHFMPVDSSVDQNFREWLPQNFFVKTPEEFVQIYNGGFINKSNDDVITIVKHITDTYRNVREHRSKLVLVEKNEVFINEVLEDLGLWKSVVNIKTELIALKDAGELTDDSVFYFLEDKPGYIFYTTEVEGADEEVRHSSAKLFSNLDKIMPLIAGAKTESYHDDEREEYQVGRFLAIDDSFIEQIKNIIPQN